LKKVQILGVLFILLALATAAAAQTAADTIREDFTYPQQTMPACNGEEVTIGGVYTVDITEWFDEGGNMHTRWQLVSSNITATSGSDTYSVLYSQKLIENVSGFPGEETIVNRLRLNGDGPLDKLFLMTEIHFTTPEGLGKGNFTQNSIFKCPGQ
jgi:hypothetical protein